MAIRGAGEGLRVEFIQFMKSGTSGEVLIFRRIPNIHYRCPGEHPFIMSRGPEAAHMKHANLALKYAWESLENQTHLLVCDEILDTIIFGTLEKERISDLMKACKGKVELVMTGREAPPEFIETADYVTELKQIKHAYYKGARARKGIEY
jgi:cob(I)alamin adenosyltransferase